MNGSPAVSTLQPTSTAPVFWLADSVACGLVRLSVNRQTAADVVDWNLRAASEDDRDFLYRLHVRTMREVIDATWGWNEEWQRADFAKRFGENEYFVIEARGTALGALCLERRTDAIYILELQLLPQYQGSGIGTDVIQGVIRDATRENLAVALSVVPANHRAKRLYERLGFEVTGVEPPFIRMARAKPSV